MTDSVALVRKLYEAFARRDVATVMALLDAEIDIEQSAALPWGGRYRGIAGAQEFFGKLVQSITSDVTVEEVFAAGDEVVLLGRTRGTVNATGRSFDVRIAHVWTVRAERFVRFRPYIDDAAILPAL